MFIFFLNAWENRKIGKFNKYKKSFLNVLFGTNWLFVAFPILYANPSSIPVNVFIGFPLRRC